MGVIIANVLSSLESLQEAYLEVQTGVNRWQNAWFTRYDNTGARRAAGRVYITCCEPSSLP